VEILHGLFEGFLLLADAGVGHIFFPPVRSRACGNPFSFQCVRRKGRRASSCGGMALAVFCHLGQRGMVAKAGGGVNAAPRSAKSAWWLSCPAQGACGPCARPSVFPGDRIGCVTSLSHPALACAIYTRSV